MDWHQSAKAHNCLESALGQLDAYVHSSPSTGNLDRAGVGRYYSFSTYAERDASAASPTIHSAQITLSGAPELYGRRWDQSGKLRVKGKTCYSLFSRVRLRIARADWHRYGPAAGNAL